jgi:ClpP class serine protease
MNKECFTSYIGAWAMLPNILIDGVNAYNGGMLKGVEKTDIEPSGKDGEDGDFTTVPYKKYGDVGVILFDGFNMKKRSKFGGFSTIDGRRAVRSAVSDPGVNHILLVFGSCPGGSVEGTADLADDIYKARSVKNVISYVEDGAYSAAYWLASQAHSVIAGRAARMGSIGVINYIYDNSEKLKSEGVKVVVSRSGDRKSFVQGETVTDEMKKSMDDSVMEIFSMFCSDVERGRNINLNDEVKRGGVFSAHTAMESGLIDAIADIDAVMLSPGDWGMKISNEAEKDREIEELKERLKKLEAELEEDDEEEDEEDDEEEELKEEEETKEEEEEEATLSKTYKNGLPAGTAERETKMDGKKLAVEYCEKNGVSVDSSVMARLNSADDVHSEAFEIVLESRATKLARSEKYNKLTENSPKAILENLKKEHGSRAGFVFANKYPKEYAQFLSDSHNLSVSDAEQLIKMGDK